MKTNLMHYLSSVYFVIQPLHVSGISVAHYQEVYCVYMCVCIYIYILKSKAVPLQALSGPQGSKNLSFPDFMTTAQGGGKVVSLTHRPPLAPGNTPGTHFC
jgi:hypothetical protein